MGVFYGQGKALTRFKFVTLMVVYWFLLSSVFFTTGAVSVLMS